MKKRLNIVIALLLSLVLLSTCSAPPPELSYRQVDMDEAVTMMAVEEDYIIVDVRTPEEYAQGHIPGAINVPNESIVTEPPEELPVKDQLLMIYCRSGNRSKQASQKLVDMGYSNVVEFGGIIDWKGEIVS